jgi:hypothetical protein
VQKSSAWRGRFPYSGNLANAGPTTGMSIETRGQISAQRSKRWNWLSFVGALVAPAIVGVLLLRSPAPHGPTEPFVRVPYVVPPAPYERTEVLRMEVPVATLLAAGLEVHVPAVEGTVSADVLIGQDGRALAIRLVSKF